MDGILSQEEISALLNDTGSENATQNTSLTDNEKDAIGEIANISMGTAATTLFSLVNRKVEISTPVVSLATWDDIVEAYERPCVFIRIAYTVGLDGNNLLILKENDVKIITDLMMDGDGTNTDGELGELHLSAICEAMNQMMGSAATSLSSMLNKTIDISPPHADLIDLQENVDEGTIDEFLKNPFVKISFKMEIGDLVNSTIMQLYPISFAKEMTFSMTSRCTDLSRTTPFFPTFSFPASNCGLIRQTISPPSRNNSFAGPRTFVREIKDTSTEAKSSTSAISSGVTYRIFVFSMQTTRSSFRSFQASWPRPTSTENTFTAPFWSMQL